MVGSWRTGRLVAHDRVETAADGIGVRVPVPQGFEDVDGLVDEAVLVGEDSIIDAMRLLHRPAGVVTEPSGAVRVAAATERPELFSGQLVGTIICGGKPTVGQMREWL